MSRRQDLAAAAALVALSQIEVWWYGAGGRHAVAAPTQAVTGAAVALRGRAPLGGVIVAVAATTVDARATGTSVSLTAILSWFVLFATAGAASSRLTRYGALGVGVAGALAMSRGNGLNAFLAAFLSSVVLPWLVGLFWTRRALTKRLELEREQAAEVERVRIARELHDIVSHNVGMIAVQATAADVVFDDDPGQARAALRAIEDGARDALVELRRLLGLLREDGAVTLAPQPMLAQLDELVARVRGSGLEVALRIEGTPQPVSAALELSVYRVVQEALTNVVKHADATSALARLSWSRDSLAVEVTDNGVGPTAASRSGGHGLTGIRERVAIMGGRFETARSADGGFSVRAHFPLRGPT